MSLIKSEQEIASMRRGGRILAEILHLLEKNVKPGHTTMDIERHAQKCFDQYQISPCFKGYNGYPYICCISTNADVVHAFPNDKPLEKGDLVTIDCGLWTDGLNTDAAISVIVGGDACASEKTRRLNQITRKALYAGIKEVKPGNKTGDIGNAIAKVVEGAGFSIIRELTGHGIGKSLHEEPTVANYGKKGTGIALMPGMVICIEPIVSAGERFIRTKEDRWTIEIKDGAWGCQWEHMILVTPNGHEILTEYHPT